MDEATLTSLGQLQGSVGHTSGEDRTTGNLSWVAQMQMYLKASQGALPASAVAHRKQLCDDVLENPTTADAWLSFLSNEEVLACQLQLPPANAAAGKRMTLLHWYHKATEMVQRTKGQAAEAYVSLWLGFARHQWASSEEEARDTFKTLRNQQIASGNARLYRDWAQLENQSGHASKAISIVQKGISERAQPESILLTLLAQLQAQGPVEGFNVTATMNITQPLAVEQSAAPVAQLRVQQGQASRGASEQPTMQHLGPTLTLPVVKTHVTHPDASPDTVLAPAAAYTQHHANTTAHSTFSRSSADSQPLKSQGTCLLDAITARPAKSGVSVASSDEDVTINCNKGHSDGMVTLTGEVVCEDGVRGPAEAAQGTTGTMHAAAAGVGIKRFGFKSKALRVTSAARVPVEESLEGPGAAVLAGTIGSGADAAACGAAADSRSTTGPAHTCQPTATDSEDAAVTRKRRSEDPAVVPLSGKSVVSLPDGAKRRSSPDTSTDGRTAGPTQHLAGDENLAPASSRPSLTTKPASLQAPATDAKAVQAGVQVSNPYPVLQARDSNAAHPAPGHANPAQSTATGQPIIDVSTQPLAAGVHPAPATVNPAPPQGMPPERLPEPQRRAMEDANWVYVSGLRYQKLDCVGRGGSSKVFKVLGCNRQIYALKRVRMNNKDAEAIQGFIDEISLLKQLRNTPNIIQLISAQGPTYNGENLVSLLAAHLSDSGIVCMGRETRATWHVAFWLHHQVFREEGLIYMVLEYGDIDLARLLHNHEEAKRRRAGSLGTVGPGELDDNFIRLYWQQMLQAVHGIHELRIVHSDLKPANFMLVQGQLKLIDFGIAKSIQGDTTSIARESQVGTLNYMSPEAIQGGANNPLGAPSQKVGRPSDVWSLGCILYQMVYGRTPFADLSFIPKMNAICNPAHTIQFPPCSNPAAVHVMRLCLDRNARTRATIQGLLDHPFLHPERAMPVDPPAAPALAPVLVTEGGATVTQEQLTAIVTQIAQASGSSTQDIASLTQQVLEKLSSHAPAPAQQKKPGPPPPPPPPPPPVRPSLLPSALQGQLLAPAPPSQGVRDKVPAGGPASNAATGAMAATVAHAAAAAAALRLSKGADTQSMPAPAALSSRPRPTLGGMPMGAELQAAILQQRTQLKPVADSHRRTDLGSAPSLHHQGQSQGLVAQSTRTVPPPAPQGPLRDEDLDSCTQEFMAASMRRQQELQ